MELATKKYVEKKISSFEMCKMLDTNANISDVSVDLVSNMLRKDFLNGPDMKALMCLFNTLMKSTEVEVKKKSGIDVLTEKVDKWMTKVKVLSTTSQEGDVYLANILSHNLQVVIKTPKKLDGYVDSDDIIREYYVGIAAMNKLRYIVPTFVYTLGAYVCPYYLGASGRKMHKMCEPLPNKNLDSTFVIYENIVGASLGSLLKEMKMSFVQYLRLFIQILIGLEVAQREVSFTHYDLHPFNVMVRSITGETNASYKVPLDNDLYTVNKPDSIATLIDFGLSTAKPDNKVPVGSYNFPEYGMLHFMSPGYDMYKLLTFSIVYAASPGLKSKLIEILQFYGNNDPYQVIKVGNAGLAKLSSEYCKAVTLSTAATYTPKMMLDWLLDRYSSILGDTIVKTERNLFLSLSYASFNKEYYDIFKQDQKGTDDAIEVAIKCANDKPKSYIMTKYYLSILKKYSLMLRDLKSGNKLDSVIKELSSYEDSNKDELIELDKAMLDKVYDIEHPTLEEVKKVRDDFFMIHIGKGEIDIMDGVVELNRTIMYEKRLQPYLQLYYTIKDTKLESTYVDWLDKFQASSVWKLYLETVSENERCKRWRRTLLDSLTEEHQFL
jgi:hypothetical protein